jgi:hypothetical protein
MSKNEENSNDQGYRGNVVTAQPVVVTSPNVGYGQTPTVWEYFRGASYANA